MNDPQTGLNMDPRAQFDADIAKLRPDLHRYCARLVGSALEGEDIVQDVLVKAVANIDRMGPDTRLRPWLFRVAHNRAIDHLRRQTRHRAQPIEDTPLVDPAGQPDAALEGREAVEAAFGHFIELPVAQRSAVIFKDVLGYSLEDIADLLEMSTNAVKAVLSRGRAKLKLLALSAEKPGRPRRASPEAARFADLFNRRDWDALRSLLADDVRLTQTTLGERKGRTEVGKFFTIYAEIPAFHLVPAFLDGGEEIIAVFENDERLSPAYLMQVEWRGGRISAIRDFRYARYILDGSVIALAMRP